MHRQDTPLMGIVHTGYHHAMTWIMDTLVQRLFDQIQNMTQSENCTVWFRNKFKAAIAISISQTFINEDNLINHHGLKTYHWAMPKPLVELQIPKASYNHS